MARNLPKTYTGDELDKLLGAPNLDTPTGLRDRCMLELMLRAGLRVGETCGLHLRDIDWREGEIRLRPEITKGNKEAVVYVDDRMLALLDRWKGVRRHYAAGKPHLFVCIRSAQRGEPVDRRRVWEMVQRRAAKSGIERHVWCHMLRHTFATDALSEFSLPEVQKLMRHGDIRTTSIYLHVRDENLKQKIRNRR
jgi:integrase/recombinase XerD